MSQLAATRSPASSRLPDRRVVAAAGGSARAAGGGRKSASRAEGSARPGQASGPAKQGAGASAVVSALQPASASTSAKRQRKRDPSPTPSQPPSSFDEAESSEEEREPPRKKTRTRFDEDDAKLLVRQFVVYRQLLDSGETVKVNTVYKSLEAMQPKHTQLSWQSYHRDNRGNLDKRVQKSLDRIKSKAKAAKESRPLPKQIAAKPKRRPAVVPDEDEVEEADPRPLKVAKDTSLAKDPAPAPAKTAKKKESPCTTSKPAPPTVLARTPTLVFTDDDDDYLISLAADAIPSSHGSLKQVWTYAAKFRPHHSLAEWKARWLGDDNGVEFLRRFTARVVKGKGRGVWPPKDISPPPALVEEGDAEDELDELDKDDQAPDQLQDPVNETGILVPPTQSTQSRSQPTDPSPPTPNPPPPHSRAQDPPPRSPAPTASLLPATLHHSKFLPADPPQSLPSPWLKMNPGMSRATSAGTTLSDDDLRMEEQLMGRSPGFPPPTANPDEDEDEDFFSTPTSAQLAVIEGYEEETLPLERESLAAAEELTAAEEREFVRRERRERKEREEQARWAAEEDALVKKFEREAKARMEADAEARRVTFRKAEEERREEEKRKERRRERREQAEKERAIEVERNRRTEAKRVEAERVERDQSAVVVRPPGKRPRASESAVLAREASVPSSAARGSTSRIPTVHHEFKEDYSDEERSSKRRRIDPPIAPPPPPVVIVAAAPPPRSLRDELKDLHERYGLKLKQLKDLLYACNVPTDLSGFVEAVEYYSRPTAAEAGEDEVAVERVRRLVWLYEEDLVVWEGDKAKLCELQKNKDLSVKTRRATLVDFGARSRETVPNRWPPAQ